jgi:hypothetical protein
MRSPGQAEGEKWSGWGNPIRGRSCAAKLSRGAARATGSVIVAGVVRNYRCFLRLLPRRVYSAIVRGGFGKRSLIRSGFGPNYYIKRSMTPPAFELLLVTAATMPCSRLEAGRALWRDNGGRSGQLIHRAAAAVQQRPHAIRVRSAFGRYPISFAPIPRHPQRLNSSSSALASFRSAVSKPSVNQL